MTGNPPDRVHDDLIKSLPRLWNSSAPRVVGEWTADTLAWRRYSAHMASPEPTLAVFGDSIANGFGLQNAPSYPQLVAEALGLRLLDRSASAKSVSESLMEMSTEPLLLESTIALIAHGITEAIPRPTELSLRLVPPRWRRLGWLDPRPWFSDRWIKGVLDRAESATRWRVKNFLIRRFGSTQVMDVQVYAAAHDNLVQELERRGARVVVVGQPDLSSRYFPGAAREMRRYAAAASREPDVSLHGELETFADYLPDHFHPNAGGHRKIAALISSYLADDPFGPPSPARD